MNTLQDMKEKLIAALADIDNPTSEYERGYADALQNILTDIEQREATLKAATETPAFLVGAVMRSAVLGEQCPTNDYKQGKPKGKCWGDGHCECKNCEHYREDFKRLGQDYVDFAHKIQGDVHFVTAM